MAILCGVELYLVKKWSETGFFWTFKNGSITCFLSWHTLCILHWLYGSMWIISFTKFHCLHFMIKVVCICIVEHLPRFLVHDKKAIPSLLQTQPHMVKHPHLIWSTKFAKIMNLSSKLSGEFTWKLFNYEL